MNLIYLLSVSLFGVLVAIILVRSAMLGRTGIKAIVFGETDKSDFLLVPMVLAIAYSALVPLLGLPMWAPLVRPFFQLILLQYVGLALCILTIMGAILTLKSFGDSFRVGIDEAGPGKLVTDGMFSYSRNPIYVCFLAFILGQFLVHPNLIISISLLLFSLAIHRQVLREEKFLSGYYGEEYEVYCRRVRRYF